MPRGRTERFRDIQPFGIDQVAVAAGEAPNVLRMENLDTDVPLPSAAVAATRDAVGADDANSWLPFTGLAPLREAVADRLREQTGRAYDPLAEVVITSGALPGLLSALLATVDHGDEVVITDPTYAGFIGRIRLAGARPCSYRWSPASSMLSATRSASTSTASVSAPAGASVRAPAGAEPTSARFSRHVP